MPDRLWAAIADGIPAEKVRCRRVAAQVHATVQELALLRQQKVENVQREFVAANQELTDKRSGPPHKLGLVYCVACGHVIGTAVPPECREAAIDRLERGLAELRQSIQGLHSALAGSMAGVLKLVAALNAREEARAKAARLNAAAVAIQHLADE